MIIKILAEGGGMKPGPALSQKLGPAGINMGQVISQINEKTNSFKGLRVPVELDVNTATKTFEIKIFSPPVSELLKKELGIDKGSGLQKKAQASNASIEQIISVAKQKHDNMLCKDLKASVKSVVGTCVSLGILVESKHPNEVQEEIDRGIYDKQISEERTTTSPEKLQELKEFFTGVKSKQDAVLKQEAAVAEAEKEAAKSAAVATPAATKTPAPAAKTAATKK